MEDFLQLVRQEQPMVHMITNYVTVNDAVNIVLAAGGTAICADASCEAAEITAISDALLLNIGTPSHDTPKAMLMAGKEANRRNLPVVLDPVGAGASMFRNEILEKLLYEVHFACIRGNRTEIAALCHAQIKSRGVENSGTRLAPEQLQRLALQTDAVIAVSGETDLIADGTQIQEVHTGTPLLKRITGAGCMESALISCWLGAGRKQNIRDSDMVTACMRWYGLAAEKAQKEMEQSGHMGTASFRGWLIDQVSCA
ncbi:MAG: hydroxyethylthiazole kinase [Butyrivibrio sp.]|nr:hydroxyethylthiazole kinase [Butyrivibrio sp.]